MADPQDRPDWLRRLDHRAMLREKAGLTRHLRPHGPASDEVVDLAGNDYLGLARDPEVIAAAEKALHDYGLGATGSRLVRGSTDEHAALEAEVARLLGQPAALVYSSGYLANLGAIKALIPPRGVIFIDAHAHASLHDGCRLSGARVEIFNHSDVAALRAGLAAHHGLPALVVTESVFSVDGDLAPLEELHSACRDAGAVLLVDDAHALGLLGPHGEGAVFDAGLAGEPDLVVTATLSKSVGAAGGVVAGPPALTRHLVDTSRPFIYDTALPPAVVAGALAGIDMLRGAGAERIGVRMHAELAALKLRDAGFEVTEPAAAIVSVTAPDAAAAVAWAAACLERGVAVGCFRPPSTPDARSRLRLTMNAGVSTSDFERALGVIVETAP
ncbi:MAG TPA: 8-amino-7-oxononanoate synthase [Acidothermaceae bacterium]|nr:8-amino-7-oxononanoate synthase [Acidothermaceae bacterium]